MPRTPASRAVTCADCGRRWTRRSRLRGTQCPDCRRKSVAPTVERLAAMAPCCVAAYWEGRLAAAVDGNDAAAMATLRSAVDQLVGGA